MTGVAFVSLRTNQHYKANNFGSCQWPTPSPGAYAVRDFLEEAQLNPVKPTYNFKGEGRKRPSIFHPKVDLSIPGVYTYMPPSFTDLARKRLATYSFKSTPRKSSNTLNFRDKDIDLAPGQYNLLPPEVPKFSAKTSEFQSTCSSLIYVPNPKSFKSHINSDLKSSILGVEIPYSLCTNFLNGSLTGQKEGPGPGEYEIKKEVLHPICSSFQSKVPRLLPIRSKIPGPGAYEPTRHFPEQPRTIESLGKEHSIFFSNTLGF
ncbi:protein STPG4 [Alligator mississippiensis]|uniref:protein STPG4 n=1 Tax=Alligator mississippiensis TaxID=8496 RepID=UPI00287782F4|nr:protein STPG4 [Alligator mississippiensis]